MYVDREELIQAIGKIKPGISNKEVIEQAKTYARQKHQSLSALVEQYFRFLVGREKEHPEQPDISPTVQQLSGILEPVEAETMREEYTDYLERKYASSSFVISACSLVALLSHNQVTLPG